MGLSINQNIMAMNSYRNLSATQTGLSKSLEKLSSGYRINRAADDAAGLAISEGLRTQVRGNTQAVRNAQDGISVVQTAEGALNEVHDILQRQRELAVQAANDSNNTDARNNIKAELDQLTEELGRIADSTNFNGTKLLDGTAGDAHDGKLNFQVGADGDSASRIVVDLASANVKDLSESLGANGEESTVTVNQASKQAYTVTAGTGSNSDNTLTLTVGGQNLANISVADGANASAMATAINNAIAADTTGNFSKVTASVENGSLVLTHSDTTQNVTMSLAATGTNAPSFTADPANTQRGGQQTATIKGIDVSNHAKAQASIELIDKKISAISTARANLGAVQNRFEHTINNLNVAVENLSASESRIRDTDMASEMMKFTRNQILSQAGTSMLAQANQVPQGVLSLLR